MPRYVVTEGSSRKFWEISLAGTQLCVRWGRLGANGQSKTRSFPDAAAARKELARLVSGKVKKGYQSAPLSSRPPIDLRKALGRLADTPGFDAVLDAVLARASAAKQEKRGLVVEFADGEPALVVEGKTIRSGDDLVMGPAGHFDFGSFSPGDAVYELFKPGKRIEQVLFEHFANETTWVLHPRLKNRHGKPALFAIEHELEERIEPIDLNPGALFLHRLVTRNQWPISLPPLHERSRSAAGSRRQGKRPAADGWCPFLRWARATDGGNVHHFSNGPLTRAPSASVLRTIKEMDLAGLGSLQDLPLGELTALTHLTIRSEGGAQIASLDGLEACLALERLELGRQAIEDLRPVAKLPRLHSLSLCDNQLRDLAPLAACAQLEELRLNDNRLICDLGPLAGLKKLRTLWLADTAVRDLAPLERLMLLKELKVPTRLPKEKLAQFGKLRPKVKVSF